MGFPVFPFIHLKSKKPKVENLQFSDVFRVYKKATSGSNGLNLFKVVCQTENKRPKSTDV